MISESKNVLFRRLSGGLGIVGLCLWFTAMYLYIRWYGILPRNPVVASGNIYPYNFHGIAIYLTHREQTTVVALETAAVVFFLTGVAFDIARRKVQIQP
jgi:hypothetical protein